MKKQRAPQKTEENEQGIRKLYADYHLFLQNYKDTDPRERQERSRLEKQITEHAYLATLSKEIINDLRALKVPSNHPRYTYLYYLLYASINKDLPASKQEIIRWNLERFQEALDFTQEWSVTTSIARTLCATPNKHYKRFYHQAWTSAWHRCKQLPQHLRPTSPEKMILSCFLAMFQPHLATRDTESLLCEMTDAFVPAEGKTQFPWEYQLFAYTVRALGLLRTQTSLQQLHTLYTRLHSPEAPIIRYYLDALHPVYAWRIPLSAFQRLFEPLLQMNDPHVERTDHFNLNNLPRWSRLFFILSSRLEHEHTAPETKERLLRSLQEATKDLGVLLEQITQTHPISQEATYRIVKQLARLNTPVQGFDLRHLPTPQHLNTEVAMIQAYSACGMDIPKHRAIQLIQNEDASIRNGTLYALAEQCHPNTKSVYLKRILDPLPYPPLAELVKRLWAHALRNAPNTPESHITAWTEKDSEEDALFEIICFLATKKASPETPTYFAPQDLLKKMGEFGWRSLHTLLKLQKLPTEQANQAWSAAFQQDLDTARWATWLLWPFAKQTEPPRSTGPVQHRVLASLMIEDLLHPSVPQTEHQTKCSWLLAWEDPLLFETLGTLATEEALASLHKHTRRRIIGLLYRNNPQRLPQIQQALELPLFS